MLQVRLYTGCPKSIVPSVEAYSAAAVNGGGSVLSESRMISCIDSFEDPVGKIRKLLFFKALQLLIIRLFNSGMVAYRTVPLNGHGVNFGLRATEQAMDINP